MSQESTNSTGERVGARPLSAFNTADIISEEETTQQPQQQPIGISPLSTTTPILLSDEDSAAESKQEEEQQSSILLSQTDDVFGLLSHSNNNNKSAAAAAAADSQPGNLNHAALTEEGEASSDEEYHSPCEDVTETTGTKRAITGASPYDYDVNWDMVGHSASSEEQVESTLNTSLAHAAASSMIATNAGVASSQTKSSPTSHETPAIPPQQPFSFRPSASFSSSTRSYRYQRHLSTGAADEEEEDEDLSTIIASDEQPQHAETASELNESSAASTTSSGSASNTPSTRRRRSRRQPQHARSSSLTSPSSRTSSMIPRIVEEESSRTSSLDSGMAAVRRWIRKKTRTGGSSRAARRWQRESSSESLQLGEEDLFALTHAGTDPRRSAAADFFPSILEEEDGDFLVAGGAVRQRALSEPNNRQMRNYFFQRAAHGPASSRPSSNRNFRRGGRDSHQYSDDESQLSGSNLSSSVSVPHLSSAALNSSLFHSPSRQASGDVSIHGEVITEQARGNSNNNLDGDVSSLAETSVPPSSTIAPSGVMSPSAVDEQDEEDDDPNREARTRWIRINRRFQLIITVVALVFSLLLFAILVCWVVFTSAYVLSIDKPCDVPVKQYFWLATLQLILDVFRTDIMRFVFRWDTHSNARIPARVILYNIAYLIYAILVLRLGVRSVFMSDDSTCPSTAPELYQSSAVFISLSIAAWSTIILGYLVPFCFVATLLTWNGYTPTAENQEQALGGVFPAAYSTTGAPPGTVDRLRTVLLEEFPDDYPRECCICMGDFVTGEVIVATECQHVFHKRCCEEWLRQARTCPVCRMDIPSSFNETDDNIVPEPPPPTSRLTRPFPGREDFHQDVVGLLQILRRQEHRLRQRNNNASDDADHHHVGEESGVMVASTDVSSGEGGVVGETELVVLEEGRTSSSSSSVTNRQHSR